MTPIAPNKIIVGLSGGVDSAVAALLLLEQGHSVEALFMKNWDEDDGTEYCTAQADFEDAARVCARLGIRLHTANFAAEYWDNVFAYFLTEYRAGRTPISIENFSGSPCRGRSPRSRSGSPTGTMAAASIAALYPAQAPPMMIRLSTRFSLKLAPSSLASVGPVSRTILYFMK
jgi:hypothetical protein